MALILVVDDVASLAEQYAFDLRRVGGFETTIASGGNEALEILAGEAVDCVILDLEMPGTDGFDVLRSLKKDGVSVPVIVYTGTGNFDRCTQAIRLGAFGFIDKAESMARVVHEVEKALEHARLRTEIASLRQNLETNSTLIGSSSAMKMLHDRIDRLAQIPSPVLIEGQSGTGKELVARELHERRFSSSRNVQFVAVNCAALPEHLIESELFGHERGAFTGASRTHKGAFESASGGSLFLDEIGELPLAAQAKLLRVLEQNEVTRVGGERTVAVHARVLAATNRDLEREVDSGSFRTDLYYRLNVHIVQVPPLRDRKSDIPALVQHFLEIICARFGVGTMGIDPGVLDILMAYDWHRNNVRELRNVVERMVIASNGSSISTSEIPDFVGGVSDSFSSLRTDVTTPPTFRERKIEAERQILVAALERNDWHISQTAVDLGLADHSSLLKIMRRHGLKRP